MNQASKTKYAVKPPSAKITETLIKYIGQIARGCGAKAIFVYVDALSGKSLELMDNSILKIYYVTKTQAEDEAQKEKGRCCIRVPNVPFNRMGQIKIALLLALSKGLLKKEDTIVFLSGLVASRTLDTIMVIQVGHEFEMFLAPQDNEKIAPHILPEVLSRVIDIATQLGSEGREGKPVGALFVIGDTKKVLSLSQQLILNPFRGYPEEARNILDPSLEETVKEYALLDGAFLIRGDGIIETMGVHLKTAGTEEFELPQGLGARHHAAAGITAVTEAVAITVSESTGTVTIFRNGKIITEIEKLRTLAQGRTI